MQTHLAIQQKSNVRKGSVKEILMPSQTANFLHFPVSCKADLQTMQKYAEPNEKHRKTKPELYKTPKTIQYINKNVKTNNKKHRTL